MGKRRRETWTFQPDDDIVEMLDNLFEGKKPDRGERTEIINEAMRLAHPEIALVRAEKEVSEAKLRLERMQKLVAQIKSREPKPSPHLNIVETFTPEQARQKAVERSSVAAHHARESDSKQKAESPSENKSSQAGGDRGHRH